MPAGWSGTSSVTLGEALFLALVALLPVMQPIDVTLLGYAIPPTDFVFVAAAVVTALEILRGLRSIPRLGWYTWLALYVVALTLSAFASADRRVSFIKLMGETYLVGLAVLATVHARDLAALRRVLIAWTAGTVVTVVSALAAILLFLAGVTNPRTNILLSIHGSLPDGAYPRVMALFMNPNMYCAYLVGSLAILVALRAAGWMGRPAFATIAWAVVVAAALSLSPGLGGLPLVAAFGTWLKWRESRPGLVRAAVIGSIAVAVLFLAAITVSPDPRAGFSLAHLRPSSRATTWAASLGTFRAHPWLGVGVGLNAVEIGYVNASGVYEWLTDAHNAWLSVLAQDGIIGLASFVGVIAALFRGAMPLGPPMLGDKPAALRSSLTIAVLAGFVYQSFSGSFEDSRHVWVLLGLLAAASHMSTCRRNVGPPPAT